MRLILNQRYFNKKMKRVETLEEVRMNHAVTDHQRVDLAYFRTNYELRDGQRVSRSDRKAFS